MESSFPFVQAYFNHGISKLSKSISQTNSLTAMVALALKTSLLAGCFCFLSATHMWTLICVKTLEFEDFKIGNGCLQDEIKVVTMFDT